MMEHQTPWQAETTRRYPPTTAGAQQLYDDAMADAEAGGHTELIEWLQENPPLESA